MFDADTQLLQSRQIVEHAPLLDNTVVSDPENGNFLYLDTPPRRFDTPERALVRASGNVAACDPIARAENVYHVFMPVGECGSDPRDAETNTFDAASLRNFRTRRPMRKEVMRIDPVNQSEVAGIPNSVKRVHKINVVHS